MEPEKYTPRLLHIKGKKVIIHRALTLAASLKPTLNNVQDNVRIEEVKLRRKYINSGDVFILDLGLKIIQVCCEKF